METALRNTLRLTITSCRRRLEEDYLLQLEGRYGIRGDGRMEPSESLQHLDAAGKAERLSIEAALQHELIQEKELPLAITRFVRESAFTALNRLAALKLMEHLGRGLILESVGQKELSRGFRQFMMVSPEALRNQPDGGYRLYLELLFDDLSQTLGVLFDRSRPQSILFPSPTCLAEILDLLNQPELSPVWEDDETIGWIYQYFTPPELRDQVRKESAAPRNGNELAFRNQFYTPRYVVEFLTDNTLGRIWYEMRRGDTSLAEKCQYLIRRETGTREKTDPRKLRVLDPACGSGHYLLYAFDLLETIYLEAYTDPDLQPEFQQEYPDLASFQRVIPGLILEHNLHGIDIDLRATQIASLALWLRAQRSFAELKVTRRQRPIVLKPQIVCAEPMPGEYDLLGEFLRDLKPAILGNLVREVWERMKGADEIGSLLKIEQDLREAIYKARQAWLATPEGVQLSLFGERPAALQLKMDLAEIKDESFWEGVEQDVLRELERYARTAAESDATVQRAVTRQLFSHDAIQGLGFVDLLMQPFDVVLMNPPFGAPSLGSKDYITRAYPRTKNDLYAAFVERGLELLRPGGMVGAITSRTGFFLKTFQQWREEILLRGAKLVALADLGEGVLDTATVKTSSYIIQKANDANLSFLFRLLDVPLPSKGTELSQNIEAVNSNQPGKAAFDFDVADFSIIPGSPFAYWVGPSIRNLFSLLPALDPSVVSVRTGLQSLGADEEFIRVWWEVGLDNIGPKKRWVNFAKGGDSQIWYGDVYLVTDWEDNGKRQKEFAIKKYNSITRKITGMNHYFHPGLTYTSYTNIGFRVRALPSGCIFSLAGSGIFPNDWNDVYWIEAVLNSRLMQLLLNLMTDGRKWEPGYVKILPMNRPSKEQTNTLSSLAKECTYLAQEINQHDEVTHKFTIPVLGSYMKAGDVKRSLEAYESVKQQLLTVITSNQGQIEKIVFDIYDVTPSDRELIQPSLYNEFHNNELSSEGDDEDPLDENFISGQDSASQMTDFFLWCTGVAFGRWDIRYAFDPSTLPPLPGPFDPLPVCSPGMLTGAEGLPLTSSPDGYPLPIAWDGFLVDDPDHPRDIVTAVRGVLDLLWADKAEANEAEACQILGVPDLRSWFRDPKGFFAYHIKRYSKSRRKAPIYWLLQSAKRSYGIWLYYPRLNPGSLFHAGREYVDAKINLETTRLEELQAGLAAAPGSARKIQERKIAAQAALVAELKSFQKAVDKAALLEIKPDLNDGVLLNIAPLHELVPWKEAGRAWQELVSGKYEWSSIGQWLRHTGLVKG